MDDDVRGHVVAPGSIDDQSNEDLSGLADRERDIGVAAGEHGFGRTTDVRPIRVHTPVDARYERSGRPKNLGAKSCSWNGIVKLGTMSDGDTCLTCIGREKVTDMNNALSLCQRYFECVENKDLQGVDGTLADDARQLFRHTKHVADPGMFDRISSGELEGRVVAVFKGKSEVLAYTKGLMSSSRRIKWVDTKWRTSADGGQIYFSGKGDMITEKSGKPYRNVYVVRFDLYQGRMVEINETGDAMTYMGLGIAPNAVQIRGLWRALLRPLGVGTRQV